MSNFVRRPIAAALVAMLFSVSANAVNIEMNGGFETGDFSGWQQFENQGTQSISSVNPASGSFSANLSISGGAGNTLIKNANIGIGIVQPGQMVDISFAVRGVTADSAVIFAELFSELDGGGVSQAEILGGGPIFATADWVTYTFQAMTGPDVSGGITVQFVVACGAVASCVGDVFFDDLSVSVAPIPVPAAVWMFASALGVMGWLRRR